MFVKRWWGMQFVTWHINMMRIQNTMHIIRWDILSKVMYCCLPALDSQGIVIRFKNSQKLHAWTEILLASKCLIKFHLNSASAVYKDVSDFTLALQHGVLVLKGFKTEANILISTSNMITECNTNLIQISDFHTHNDIM